MLQSSIIALFLALSAIMFWQPKPANSTDYAQSASSPEPSTKTPALINSSQASASDAIRRSEWVQIFIGGFVALVIFWQAWIYNEQRRALDRQLWQNYLAERAYMTLLVLEVSPLQPRGRMTFSVQFVNGGRTPAWNFATQIHFNIGTDPELVPFWNENLPKSHAFVAAGQKHSGGQRTVEGLPLDQFNGIEDGSMTLFVLVESRYWDYRNERRVERFVGWYDRGTGQFIWHEQPQKESQESLPKVK